MTCSPSQTATLAPASSPARERIRTRAESLILSHATPEVVGLLADQPNADAAIATGLMDVFRATRDREAFDCLVHWAGPQLLLRVRTRLRSLGALLDPQEVWQDAIVNIYRYPDRFRAARPGAFAAWSSTIVDNAIRRQLRRSRHRLGVLAFAPELLQEQPDRTSREPAQCAEDQEECEATAQAFSLLLQGYLAAFDKLGDRERLVLQLVEVRNMRYAEVAQLIGVRPEALKMVVFRARKRIHEHLVRLFGGRRPAVEFTSAVA